MVLIALRYGRNEVRIGCYVTEARSHSTSGGRGKLGYPSRSTLLLAVTERVHLATKLLKGHRSMNGGSRIRKQNSDRNSVQIDMY